MEVYFTAESSVGAIVTQNPDAARVFERLGIDYCCGGRRPLREACAKRQVDPASVLAEIESRAARPGAGTDRNWSAASLTELADHIEQTHHAYLKTELPRLAERLAKVASVHGAGHPEMIEVSDIFHRFADDLAEHMIKEEAVLFPALRTLEKSDTSVPTGLAAPIARMMLDHDDAGSALARMRALTNGYTPPADACTTFRVALASLAQLEADMHQHVHKENNILFPAALRTQRSHHEPGPSCCAREPGVARG